MIKIDFSNIKTTLKGSNLAPSGINVTVKKISKRDTTYGEKLVLDFHENNSEMFVNETQLKTMQYLFGHNPKNWLEKTLHLTSKDTDYGPTIVISEKKTNAMFTQ